MRGLRVSIKSKSVVWAVLLLALPFLRAAHAQVLDLNPTYFAQYYWDPPTGSWKACPNTSTAEPYGSTPQAITVAGLNSGLGQWTPGVGASSCLSGPGGLSVTWPASGDVVISNATNSPAGIAPVNGDCLVGSGGAWALGACSSGPTLDLKHDGTNLVSQTTLNFLDSPASLPTPALDAGYNPVVVKSDTTGAGGIAFETASTGSQIVPSMIPPGSGQYEIVLYPTSVAGYIQTPNPTCSAPSSAGVAPQSGGIARSGSGPFSAPNCTETFSGFAPAGSSTAGLPSYVLPANITSIYWGALSSLSGNRGSGQTLSATCSYPIGLTCPGASSGGGATWALQYFYSTAWGGSFTGIDFTALTYIETDSSTRDCTGGAQYGCPSTSTFLPFVVIWYTASTPPPTPSQIEVAIPLLYNDGTLSLSWPYNVAVDSESGTIANTYAASIPSIAVPTLGTQIVLIPQTSNTSATPSFNLNAGRAYAITNSCGGVLVNGDISASHNALLQLDVDGTWHLLNAQVSSCVGNTVTLTTTGTTGASTYSGGTLNIPVYQGQLSLTTSGSSGPATLSGNALNIPQYSGGGGGGVTAAGVVPSNVTLVFTGTSINDDDTGAIETPVSTSGYTCSGSGTYTCVVTSSLAPAVGDWINMRNTPDFGVGSAHFPSYIALGTGYSLFKVSAIGSGTFSFTETLGAYTCSSTCGTVAAANYNLPFATWIKLGKPGTIEMALPSTVTIVGLNSLFTSMFPSVTPPCTFSPGNELNDVQLGTPASTIEAAYQGVWNKVHTLGCTVVQESANATNISQNGFTGPDVYQNLFLVENWLKAQGPQNALASGGQYWDLYADVFAGVNDGNNTNLVASNNGFAAGGADKASSQIANVLFSGKSDTATQGPQYFGAHNGVTNQYTPGFVIKPSVDGYSAFQVNDSNNNQVFSVDTQSVGVSSGALLIGTLNILSGTTSPNEPELVVTGQGGIYHYQPQEVISAPVVPDVNPSQGESNWTYSCWQDLPFGTSGQVLGCFGEDVNAPGGSAALNGMVLNNRSTTTIDAFHADNNGLFCVAPISINSSSFTPGTTDMCPNQSAAFSVGTAAQMWVDSSGNTTVNNLAINGTCTGCSTGNSLTAAASGGAAPGSTFNGSAAVTFDYHSFGAAGLAASNTFTGSTTNDFSATSQFKLPVVAGYSAAASGELGHDSTNHNWHIYSNGVDNFLAFFPSASPPTSGDCAKFLLTSTTWTLADAGAACNVGTVTSVAMTMPGVLFNSSVAGSPITSSGTLAPTLATQTANMGLWGPTSGSAATPTFRSLVNADFPSSLAPVFSAANLTNFPSQPIAVGYCGGTATSSTTLYLYDLGAAGTNCTVTAIASAAVFLATKSGTISNLSVTCGTTGVSSSSGVFTLVYAASGTAMGSASNSSLTVTYGTTAANTVMQDTTHTLAYSAGYRIAIKFTTQGSETLANCTASFNY